MEGMFLDTLKAEQKINGNGEEWTLLEDLTYQDEDGTLWTAPAGFITDFASIPRIMWITFPKSGKHNRAAVIHDWLCKVQLLSSSEVHNLFKRALKACGVNWISRQMMWTAVRIGGPRFPGPFSNDFPNFLDLD